MYDILSAGKICFQALGTPQERVFVTSFFRVVGFVVGFGADDVSAVRDNIETSGRFEILFELEMIIEIGFDRLVRSDVDDTFRKDDTTGVCDGCTVNAIAGGLVSRACGSYYTHATQSTIGDSVSSDARICKRDA